MERRENREENLQNQEGQRKEQGGRTSGIVRIVGVSEEKEQEILAGIEENFGKQEIGKIDKREREKTPEELEIIGGILTAIPEFIKRHGGEPLPLQPEHIHVIDYTELTDEERRILKGIRGHYNHALQAAIVITDPEKENRLTFALRAAHELIHFSAFQSAQIINEKEKEWGIRIGGFIVKTKEAGKTEFYFNDIDEAVTEELIKRFDREYFGSIPGLSEDLKRRQEFRENILQPDPDTKEIVDDIAIVETTIEKEGEHKGMYKTTTEHYNFLEERERLWKIIEGIQQKNPGQFKSKEEVFDVFAKAYFTGRLLPVARLVERTYGKGSFRKLGAETKAKEARAKEVDRRK